MSGPGVSGTVANPFGGPPPWDPGISFTGVPASSAPADEVVSWSLDLGDGSAPITGSWPSGTTDYFIDLTGVAHYAGTGVFTPAITVTDASALTDTSSLSTVTVTATSPSAGGTAAAATDTSARGRTAIRQPPQPVVYVPNLALSAAYGLDTTAYPPSPIPQHTERFTVAPYVVADGLAMDKPLCGAMSRSTAYARTWAYATDLGAELALGLMGANARWLPFAGDYSTDPVDGTKIRWNPHFGSVAALGGKTWYKRGGYPYIDTSYEFYGSYERLKTTQAMVHDGNGWFLLDDGHVSAFTWIIVAVLHHPEKRHDYDILSTFQPGVSPDRARDCNLRYETGNIRSFQGARMSSTRLNAPVHKGRIRPTILTWGESDRHGLLGVTDALGKHWHEYAHGSRAPFDFTNFKLGMNGAIGINDYAAIMDVLDMMFFSTRLTVSQAKPIINKLDHVYGVTGR